MNLRFDYNKLTYRFTHEMHTPKNFKLEFTWYRSHSIIKFKHEQRTTYLRLNLLENYCNAMQGYFCVVMQSVQEYIHSVNGVITIVILINSKFPLQVTIGA